MLEARPLSPASLEASNSVDAYGMLRGHGLQQADREQAYSQAPLGRSCGGVKTWACLPTELCPSEFATTNDPILPGTHAIYGHANSWRCWEENLEASLRRAGCSVATGWPSVSGHEKLKSMNMVYVGDVAMVRP
jgi:hypothetical protein